MTRRTRSGLSPWVLLFGLWLPAMLVLAFGAMRLFPGRWTPYLALGPVAIILVGYWVVLIKDRTSALSDVFHSRPPRELMRGPDSPVRDSR
jgi:hypothetical protein